MPTYPIVSVIARIAARFLRGLIPGLLIVLTAQAQSFLFPPPTPELTMIFRPFETDHVTLSPGGRHLAYTERQGEALFLVLHNLETNTRQRISVGVARTEELSGAREKTPAAITFLRWGDDDRLVFNLNGRNVWSIRADGSDSRLLADARTYAPELPPNEYRVIADGEGIPNIMVEPPPIFGDLEESNQPVNVSTMLRGERHVFVEAVMTERGFIRDVRTGLDDLPQHIRRPDPRGAPRVVFRVDLATGRRAEWGEAPKGDFLVADQQGHPRLILRKDDINNPYALTTRYHYVTPKQTNWKPLDETLPGKEAKSFTVTPETRLGERSIPLGFDHNADLLYFASNVGRDTFGIYAINTKTRERTDVAVETPVADLFDPNAFASGPLIFDDWRRELVGVRYTGPERATLWLDEELAEVQRTLEAVDVAKQWEIVEWDEARERFLVLATSNTEPGIYYLFNRDTSSLDEVLTRAPWLTDAGRNPSKSFGFQTRDGVNLSGYLTLPRKPVLERPPLVVLCHDGPWERDYPGYNREAQALAWMGFMVLQVNFRGSAGFGQKHLNALRDGFDTVALDDVLAAIDAVTPKNVDRRLVAIMGRGYGGYLALRAMQLHPTRFRCAVAIDAPTDLNAWIRLAAIKEELDQASIDYSPFDSPWRSLSASGAVFEGAVRQAFFGTDPERLRNISPLSHAEKNKGPVMIVQGEDFAIGHGREFARALAAAGRQAEFLSLSRDEMADRPVARAALFTKIHAFLNENIYSYAVSLGDAVEVK